MSSGDTTLEAWNTKIWVATFGEDAHRQIISRKPAPLNIRHKIVYIELITNGWVSNNTLRNAE